MKKVFFGRKGSITLFLCIVLSAAIILESVYIKGAYQRKQEVLLTRAVSHQTEQILSQFDREALDWYGIYVLDQVVSDHAVFDQMTDGNEDMSFSYDLTDHFSSEDLKISISEFMRLRGLAFEGSGIMDRLGISLSKISGSGAVGSSGLGTWLPTFKDYIFNRDKYSDMWSEVEDKCIEYGVEDKLSDFYTFVDQLEDVAKRNISSVMEIGDSSITLSLFDPSCMDSLTSAMDQYMDYQLPSVVDRLLINEYAAFSFDSRVTAYESDDGPEEEANIIGIPFSEIHGENTCDLEYLLIGNSSSGVNKGVCYAMILGTRLILDFCAFLMDDTMRNIALAIATVVSILVSVCSLFIINVDPTAIQFAILFFMAFIRAVSDTGKLVAGKTVPLFYNDSFTDTLGDFSDTTYRDYFRIFLLFVPEDQLLDRMKDVIERDCGEDLYTGVKSTGYLRDTPYTVNRRFELYANRG